MLISDIETMAAYQHTLSFSTAPKAWILYCCFAKLYSDYKTKKITKEQASTKKKEIISYIETIEALAHSNSKIIHELAVATAPRKDLIKKDKAELLEVISRIEGVVCGLMKEFDGKIPEFLKFKEDKNERNNNRNSTGI